MADGETTQETVDTLIGNIDVVMNLIHHLGHRFHYDGGDYYTMMR